MKKLLNSLIILLPAILFLAAWEFFCWNNQQRQFLFAAPSLIFKIAQEELAGPIIWNDIFVTCIETFLGLLVGSFLGTCVGLLLWSNKQLAAISRPYVVLLGAVPIFAIAPMLIIWFGIGLLSKVVMAAFAVFFVALAQAYDGAKVCTQEHAQYAATLAAPRARVLRQIILPGALHWVIAGLKISVGLALVGAFIGEFVSSQAGLGHYILGAGSLYDMPRVLFGVLIISLLALIATGIISMVERWKPNLFAR